MLEFLPVGCLGCAQIRPVRRKGFRAPVWTLAVSLSPDSQIAQILHLSSSMLSQKTGEFTKPPEQTRDYGIAEVGRSSGGL